MPELAVIPLEHLDVLSVRGPDARAFLQGQLSQDIGVLVAGKPQMAGLHDPQGRCLAVLRLFALEGDQILAVLPRDLVATVVAHLRRYVLRSKVQLEAATSQWFAYGLLGPDAKAAATTRQHMTLGDDGMRELIVAPRLETLPEADRMPESLWHAQDIEDGAPQVFAATSGQFTAQMLNLDLVRAVSFSKGCYTGQEIIARTHYLGKVKRRMRRFHSPHGAGLLPGASVTLEDGRQVLVVNAARVAGGETEFLAVAPAPASSDASRLATALADSTLVPATELPLPYALVS
jgi:tRNA-modifying protein YgfZ